MYPGEIPDDARASNFRVLEDIKHKIRWKLEWGKRRFRTSELTWVTYCPASQKSLCFVPIKLSKTFLQSLTCSHLDGFLVEFASVLIHWFDKPLIFSRILPDLPARDYRISTQISSPSKHLLAPKAMWC